MITLAARYRLACLHRLAARYRLAALYRLARYRLDREDEPPSPARG